MNIKRIVLPTFEISAKPKVNYADLNIKIYRPFRRSETGQSIWVNPKEGEYWMASTPRRVGKLPVRNDKYVR